MIKHATASTYVFGKQPGGWRLGLVTHPLFGRLTLPGGHVEPDESAAEAALREVTEESGLAVTLLPAPAAPLPAEVAAVRVPVPSPWWILEQPCPSDNHLAKPHRHIDHLYVARAVRPEPVTVPGHPFGWYRRGELPGLGLFPDTRLLADYLFGQIPALTGEAG